MDCFIDGNHAINTDVKLSPSIPLSPQQHPHNLLHPLPLDRLPQPLPYLPTSNRNRQPSMPLPQIPQLPLNIVITIRSLRAARGMRKHCDPRSCARR